MSRVYLVFFFFSSRRRHTRCGRDWSSDVCSSDLVERDVERRVIDVILKALVEADDDVDRSTLVTGGEIARQRAGGDRELLDASLDEVARRRGLGKDDEVGLGIELHGLRDDGTDPRDIRVVLPFGWSELGDRETDVRHAWKDMTVRDGKG